MFFSGNAHFNTSKQWSDFSEWLPDCDAALGHPDVRWVMVDVTDSGGLTCCSCAFFFSSLLPVEMRSVTSVSRGASLLWQAVKLHSKLWESPEDDDSGFSSFTTTADIWKTNTHKQRWLSNNVTLKCFFKHCSGFYQWKINHDPLFVA